MSNSVDEWRTKEMSLAAYLVCKDHQYLRMEIEDGSCYWVFSETDELTGEIMGYLEGSATVEPSKFNLKMVQMKREMFDHSRATGASLGARRSEW